jgi:hypothetical protein
MYFDTAPPWRDGSTKGVTSFVTASRDPAKRENPRNLFPAARPQGVTNYQFYFSFALLIIEEKISINS